MPRRDAAIWPATQGRFADALLDCNQAVPPGLTCWNQQDPKHRFAVHRNNVASGLTGALASRFPVAERIVGRAFFAAMAQVFIVEHPPRSPLLLQYGDDLAEFIEGFQPAKAVPYLADVVRLEAARGKAHHAADETPLDPMTFATLVPERLQGVTVTIHDAVSVVPSRHPIVTIWAMNTGEMLLQPIDLWPGEDALVTRPSLTVEVRRLPAGGAAFVSALSAGETLGLAIDLAFEAATDFDVAANIAGVIEAGLITAVR